MYYRLQTDPHARQKGLEFPRILEFPEAKLPWFAGIKSPVRFPGPLRFVLDPHGKDLPDLFLVSVPLFSEKLLKTLAEAGVTNLDTYDAELVRPGSSDVNRDYKAVNIVGKIACADMAASQFEADSEFPMIEFSRLVVDESKTHGAHMFRLAENILFILVSEHVRQALDGAGLAGVQAVSLEERGAY
jgi:hypothetical protein